MSSLSAPPDPNAQADSAAVLIAGNPRILVSLATYNERENLPLVAAALYVTVRHVPESRDETATDKRIDLTGGALLALGLSGIVFGLIEGPPRGWDALPIVTIVAGAIALVLFVVTELRSPHPMVPMRIFRSQQFSGANLATLAVYAALSSLLFLLVGCAGQTGQRAASAYRAKQFGQAASLYRKMINDGDRTLETVYNYGTSLLAADSLTSAAEALERAAESRDAELRYRALFNLGLTHLVRGLALPAQQADEPLDGVGDSLPVGNHPNHVTVEREHAVERSRDAWMILDEQDAGARRHYDSVIVAARDAWKARR